jgi:hypothetical protein
MCRDVQRLFKVQWRFSPSSFWDLTSIAVSAFCLSRQRFFAIFWYIETCVYIMSQCISVHKTPWDVRFQFHAQNGGRSMLKLHDSAEWHQIRILYSDLQGTNDPVAAALYPWKLTWPLAQCHGSLIWFTRGDKIHYMQAEGAKDVNYCSQKIPDCHKQTTCGMHSSENAWVFMVHHPRPGFRRNTPACSLLQQLQKDCKRSTRCKFHR